MFTRNISEVATIVKSNMGDQPTLPRNLENMVKQECRKTHARERLRKKHEMRKQTSGATSSLLDSLDEGPSPTSEKKMEFPNSSGSAAQNGQAQGDTKEVEVRLVADSKKKSIYQAPIAGSDKKLSIMVGQKPPPNVKVWQTPGSCEGTTITSFMIDTTGGQTAEELTRRFAEMGIAPPKSFPKDVLKTAEKILPPKSKQSSSDNGKGAESSGRNGESSGAKVKEVKPEETKSKGQGQDSKKGKKETPNVRSEASFPTPERLKVIQDLLKQEYRERFADHHMSDQQNLIVGKAGPNITVAMPTKKSPEELLREINKPPKYKAEPIIFDTPSEKAEEKSSKEEKKTEDAAEDGTKPKKLRSCANCGDVEPSPRTFKKCQRCKSEGVKKSRYYCGRTCQVEDWGTRHKQEHQDGQI